MTRQRWIVAACIIAAGLVALLYRQGLVAIQLLWGAVALGLYPLVKTGVLDLIRERKIGTEIFARCCSSRWCVARAARRPCPSLR